MEALKSLWEVWESEVPSKFSKSQAISSLEKHWGITRSNVIIRLKSGRFDVVKDLSAFYRVCFIGFNQNVGFFFDRSEFEKSIREEETSLAESFGLSL